ncbi:MAG: Zn-ribbon domain-containing OB-fold protein [Burkholderiaceae bacterium]
MTATPVHPTASPKRPRPEPDAVTQPFWEAVNRRELRIQRCEACEGWQHPPAARCHGCGATTLSFQPVSGRARLVSWTKACQPLAPGFSASVPYINLLVELDEQAGLMMLSDSASCPLDEEALHVGARMRLYFEEIAAGLLLPQFTLDAETAR